MIKSIAIVSVLSIFALGVHSPAETQSKESSTVNKTIYNFKMKDIDGKDVSLNKFKGKVVMVVNVASHCGYTPQYEQLEALYKKYKNQGLVILGFPANNFHGQEPGTNEEIKQFCTSKYGVTFPMFAKISVKGEDIDPLYQYLTSKDDDPKFAGDITWNFNKFLIDKHGNIIDRFDSKIKPDDETVTSALETALKEK